MTRQFSAGGIVYKREDGRVRWLVRKPTAGRNYRGNPGWGFPKGWIDPGETTEEAAVREVREEAGVEAEIRGKLPTFKVFFTDPEAGRVMKFITYFIMEFTADVPEGFDRETEEIRWVSAQEAEGMLVFKNDKELLRTAAGKVENK